jgi:UV DNA damage endonuclease
VGIRWGLCCQFADGSVRFRQATHRYVATLEPAARVAYLRDVARANAIALAHAIARCDELAIGAFRINSQVLPLITHPVSGYTLQSLDVDGSITRSFAAAGALGRARDVRLSFHPDQFVVLNSLREEVVISSVRELDAQAALASIVGADTITLHVGGATEGKGAALERLERNMERLAPEARSRLALENDDRLFTVRDLLPLCKRTGVPLVYDVHHHRCNPDGLDVEAATDLAIDTWRGREPWMHVSTARDGTDAPNPRPHADHIAPRDVPSTWLTRDMTVDVEAKAKDDAIVRLREALRDQPRAVNRVVAPSPPRGRLAR